MEVVSVGQPCDLRQVESRQPDADADQDTLECFSGPHLKDMILLDGDALRVPHFKPCEQDVQGGLVFLIFFPDFRCRQHFHHHGKVLFFFWGFMHEIEDECL